MEYTIFITQSAIKDIDEGVEYYNTKVVDLGFKFTEDIDENLKLIGRNPFAFSERYKTVRGKLLKNFPFLILYQINSVLQRIEILRIFNTHKNPYWD